MFPLELLCLREKSKREAENQVSAAAGQQPKKIPPETTARGIQSSSADPLRGEKKGLNPGRSLRRGGCLLKRSHTGPSAAGKGLKEKTTAGNIIPMVN